MSCYGDRTANDSYVAMNRSYEKVWLTEDNYVIIEKEVTQYPVVNVVN